MALKAGKFEFDRNNTYKKISTQIEKDDLRLTKQLDEARLDIWNREFAKFKVSTEIYEGLVTELEKYKKEKRNIRDYFTKTPVQSDTDSHEKHGIVDTTTSKKSSESLKSKIALLESTILNKNDEIEKDKTTISMVKSENNILEEKNKQLEASLKDLEKALENEQQEKKKLVENQSSQTNNDSIVGVKKNATEEPKDELSKKLALEIKYLKNALREIQNDATSKDLQISQLRLKMNSEVNHPKENVITDSSPSTDELIEEKVKATLQVKKLKAELEMINSHVRKVEEKNERNLSIISDLKYKVKNQSIHIDELETETEEKPIIELKPNEKDQSIEDSIVQPAIDELHNKIQIIAELNEMNANLENECDSLRAELEETINTLADSESKRREINYNNNEGVNIKADKESQDQLIIDTIELQKREIKKLENLVDKLEEENTSKQNAINILHKNNSTKTNETESDMRHKFEVLRETNKKLFVQKNELIKENNVLKKQIDHSGISAGAEYTLSRQIKDLNAAITKQNKENLELLEKNKDLNMEKETFIQTNQKLRNKVADLEKNSDKQESKCKQIQSEKEKQMKELLDNPVAAFTNRNTKTVERIDNEPLLKRIEKEFDLNEKDKLAIEILNRSKITTKDFKARLLEKNEMLESFVSDVNGEFENKNYIELITNNNGYYEINTEVYE